MYLLVLIAQEINSPSSPTIIGLLGVLAMGVAALLGVVVKWLLSHITELTKQNMESSVSRDKLTLQMQHDFREALSTVTAHCEREIMRQSEVQKERAIKIDASISRNTEALESLRDTIAALHARVLSGASN